jgi:hypothetical protein
LLVVAFSAGGDGGAKSPQQAQSVHGVCGSQRLPNNRGCRVMFPDKARLRRLLPRLQTKSKLSLPSR